MDIFFRILMNQMKFSFILDLSRKSLELCDSILIYDLNISDICSTFHSYKAKSSLYLVNRLTHLELFRLEGCASKVFPKEVVNISQNNSLIFELSPAFSPPRYFFRSSVAKVIERRLRPSKVNLKGTTLKVAAMEFIPFFMTKTNESKGYDGIEVQVVQELARRMNFTVEYIVFEYWGTILANNSWLGGIAGAVQNGRADLAISGFWQSILLYPAMDYGPAMAKIQSAFVARRPNKIEFKLIAILGIFQSEVWFAILASFTVAVVVYWCGSYWNLYPEKEGWLFSVMTILGHLLLSSYHCKRRGNEGNTRYTLTSWSVLSLLLYISLSTNIAARLTHPLYGERIDTLKQLAEGQYYWTVDYYNRIISNNAAGAFIFNFDNPWHRRFESKYKYLSIEEILNRTHNDQNIVFPVQQYGYDVFVFNTPGLAMHKAIRSFRLVKEYYCESRSAIGIKKHSPLLEPLTVLNQKFLEFGLVSHWKDDVMRRWPQYNNKCLVVEDHITTYSEPQRILLNKVQPIFYMLLVGLGISSLVFVLEMCVFNRFRSV